MPRSARFPAIASALLTFGMAAIAVAGPAQPPPDSEPPAEADAVSEEPTKPTGAEPTAAGPDEVEAEAAEATPAEPAEPTFQAEATKLKTVKGKALGVTLKIQTFSLSNGLRVYVVEDHSIPAFSMHTAFEVGSRDEREGQAGYAHFFEHMMFKGSENVPDKGHFQYVLGAGGKMNAFTTADVTQYYNVLPSQYLDMALWLESDRLRSLDMTPENFENQRAAVSEERSLRYENVPYRLAITELMSEVWKGSGYGHPTIGSKEDLAKAKLEDLQGFFDTYYVPNNAVIAIVGDVSAKEVRDKVLEYYGDIPPKDDRPSSPEVDHTQVAIDKTVKDPMARQPLYLMGWQTVPESHPDRVAIDLLVAILLRGSSSRVTRVLVDDKKLAAQALSFPGPGHDAGMAIAAVIPAPNVTWPEIKDAVLEQVEAVVAEGVTSKELRKAVNQVTVDAVEGLATNNFRAGQIARGALLEDNPTYVLDQLDRYQKVTLADIKRVAETYLTDKLIELQVVPGTPTPTVAPAPAEAKADDDDEAEASE